MSCMSNFHGLFSSLERTVPLNVTPLVRHARTILYSLRTPARPSPPVGGGSEPQAGRAEFGAERRRAPFARQHGLHDLMHLDRRDVGVDGDNGAAPALAPMGLDGFEHGLVLHLCML